MSTKPARCPLQFILAANHQHALHLADRADWFPWEWRFVADERVLLVADRGC